MISGNRCPIQPGDCVRSMRLWSTQDLRDTFLVRKYVMILRCHVKGSLLTKESSSGQRLPIEKILSAVPKAFKQADNSHQSWLTSARSICTTDTFPKLLSTTFKLPSSPKTTYSLAGMAKGAGMYVFSCLLFISSVL